MNILYNKIYEAINTGIQKALIIDPVQDVSVKWHDKKITTDFNIQKMLDDVMINVLYDSYENINVDMLKDVLSILNGQKYKVSSFYDVKNLLRKFENLGIDYDVTDLIDVSDLMVYILKDGTEVPVSKDIHDFVFLKIFTKQYKRKDADLNIDDNILIPYNWKDTYFKNTLWTQMSDNMHDLNFELMPRNYQCESRYVNYDFNGYGNCENILKRIKRNKNKISGTFPALQYACSQHIIVNGETYAGYIPSYKQLKVIQADADIINLFTNDFIKNMFAFDLWTSNYAPYEDSMYDVTKIMMWVCNYDGYTGHIKVHKTTSLCGTIPFFKKDKILINNK